MTPEDPRHGSRAGYLAGCRQECCTVANRRDVKARQLRVLREGPCTVDGAPVAGIVEYWAIRGVSIDAIAAGAGLARDSIVRCITPGRRILRTSLTRLQAVTEDDLPEVSKLYADLTRARLGSMMAAGHPLGWIVDHVPHLTYSGHWRARRRVTVRVARAVRDLYDTAPTFGPSQFTASRAATAGYLVPAAWDDPGTLTEPLGWQPTSSDPDTEWLDEQAIYRRMNGDRTVPLTPSEKAQVVRRMIAAGRSYKQITAVAGITKPDRYLTRGEAA